MREGATEVIRELTYALQLLGRHAGKEGKGRDGKGREGRLQYPSRRPSPFVFLSWELRAAARVCPALPFPHRIPNNTSPHLASHSFHSDFANIRANTSQESQGKQATALRCSQTSTHKHSRTHNRGLAATGTAGGATRKTKEAQDTTRRWRRGVRHQGFIFINLLQQHCHCHHHHHHHHHHHREQEGLEQDEEQ